MIALFCALQGAIPTDTWAASVRSDSPLKSLQRKIREIKELLFSRKSEAKSLEAKLEAVESEQGRVAAKLGQREREYDERNVELKELIQRREMLRGQLLYHRQALVRQVKTAFELGRQEKLKLLLNQTNPSVVGRTLAYYDYFNHDRARQIVSAQDSLDELKSVEADIREQVAKSQKALLAIRENKAKIDATRAQRASLVATLHEEIASSQSELDRLLEDQNRLQNVVDQVAAQPPEPQPEKPEPVVATPQIGPRTPPAPGSIVVAPRPALPADSRSFSQLRGQMAWPTSGSLRARFGESRGAGSTLRWQGVYIAARQGGEVHAVSAGRVAFANWIRGFGLMVILDHGDGYMSLYGHNQSVFRKSGDRVQAGDVISTIGDSGGQEGAGLYFEIRNRGKPVDPEKWCEHDSRLVRTEP